MNTVAHLLNRLDGTEMVVFDTGRVIESTRNADGSKMFHLVSEEVEVSEWMAKVGGDWVALYDDEIPEEWTGIG